MIERGWLAGGVVAAVCGIAVCVWAIEPPRESVPRALRQAKVAFVGRVVSLRELERRPAATRAEAEFLLERCLCGTGCTVGAKARLAFFSESTQEYGDPSLNLEVTFHISERVLVTLHAATDLGAVREFDSNFEDGIDLAYTIESYPEGYVTDEKDLSVSSVYTGTPAGTIDLTALPACGAK